MNNLSADLDVLRPSILETGLECIAYNNNRRNSNLQLFEYGKTYHTTGVGNYSEEEHLALYITGANHEDTWQAKGATHDFYRAKGLATAMLNLCGLLDVNFAKADNNLGLTISNGKQPIGTLLQVDATKLKAFDIKQAVYFIDINYLALVKAVEKKKIVYKEVSKFPAVQRDLALIVNSNTTFDMIETAVQKTKLNKLTNVRLFDVFESDKLGAGKKSMAVNFTFLDEEKTLVDKEVDSMINKLIASFESELQAEIRK
jgi:phenylalanyl-tRNA synthetase beta chain